MPQLKDYNISPYWDDHNPAANYMRMLFNPARGVQARELTQLQTILQNQVATFADHIFKDGSNVYGGEIKTNNKRTAIKFDNWDATNTQAIYFLVDTFKNKLIEGVVSGAKGYVISEFEQVAGSGLLDGLIVDTRSGTFIAGEAIATIDDNSGVGYASTGSGNGVQNTINAIVYTLTTSAVTNDALTANVDAGILYTKGHFVVIPTTEIVVDVNDSSAGSYKIGYVVTESEVTSAQDSTLTDPSSGQFNFGAPGADRYKIAVTFSSFKSADYASIGDDFYLVIEYKNGKVVIDQSEPSYGPIMEMLASRMHDHTGNFTIKEFPLTVIDDASDPANYLKYELGQGNAYVNGYEIETIHSESIQVNKTRTLAHQKEFTEDLEASYGPYFEVLLDTTIGKNSSYDLTYLPSVSQKDIIYFWSQPDGSGTLLGQGRIIGIERRYSTLRIYFRDGSDSSTNGIVNKFASVWSISDSNSSGSTRYVNVNRDADTNPSTYNNNNSNLLFALSKNNIKDFVLGLGTTTDFETQRFFESVAPSGNTITINAITGQEETFLSADSNSGIVAITATDGTSLLNYTDEVSGVVVNNAVNPPSMVITFNDLSAANPRHTGAITSVDVVVRVKKENSLTNPATKTQLTNTDTAAFTYSNATGNSFSLSKHDIISIISIKRNSDNAVVTLADLGVVLDNGQRDHMYLTGAVTIPAGLDPTGLNVPPQIEDGVLYNIEYSYYSHSGGQFFVADSYPDYESIPVYQTENRSQDINLRDVIDFRRTLADVGTGTQTISPNSLFNNLTYAHYLPRRDKIFINEEGSIKHIEGVPDELPSEPQVPTNSMILYDVLIPAYLYDIDDVVIEKKDNRVYTMRDIAELSERVDAIEYTSAMSMLEQETENKVLFDENGLEKFKSGIVVDNFTGHGIGDFQHEDYFIAIDAENNIAHAPFTIANRTLDFNAALSSNVQGAETITSANQTADQLIGNEFAVHENIVTLGYSEVNLIDQSYASESMNVNPYNVFSWNGSMRLFPASDNWHSTTRLPATVTNFNGNNDGWKATLEEANKGFQTNWGAWKTTWQGTRTIAKFALSRLDSFRDGGAFSRRSFDVRETTIESQQTGTRLQYVPKTIRKNVGDRIVSTSVIPFMRTRNIRFYAHDMKPNTEVVATFDDVDVGANIIWGNFSWNASNASYQGTGNNGKVQPNGKIWGTLVLPGDTFRTGTKIFRLEDAAHPANPDTASEASFTSQGVLNKVRGTIVSTEVPELRRVSVSRTSVQKSRESVLTNTVRWKDPLAESFLVSEKGGTFVTSIELLVRYKDPEIPLSVHIVENVNGYPSQNIVPFSNVSLDPSGFLPAPNNNETQIKAIVQGRAGADPSPSADLATAIIGSNHSVSNENADLWTKFSFSDPVYLKEGTEYSIVVMANCNNYEIYVAKIGDKNVSDGKLISKQPYAGVMFKSQNASTWTADQTRDLSFKMNRASFVSSGTIVTDYTPPVGETEDINTLNINCDFVEHANTAITWQHRFSSVASWENVDILEDITFDTTKSISGQVGSEAPYQLKASLSQSSTNNNLSPVIAKNKLNVIMIENEIGTIDLGGGLYEAGTYITRTAKLDKPADDLRVYFNLFKPANTDVDVYYRTGDLIKQYVAIDDYFNATSFYEDESELKAAIEGKLLYVYQFESTGSVLTKQSGHAIGSSVVEVDASNWRLYMKEISEVDQYKDAGHAGNTFEEVVITVSPDVVTYTSNHALDEYVYYATDGRVYKSLIANNSNVPSAFNSTWQEVPSFTIKTGFASLATDSGIVDESVTDGWLPMVQTNADFTHANNLFEYEYHPEDKAEEFTSFSVKVVLKANVKYRIPIMSSFRTIASY